MAVAEPGRESLFILVLLGGLSLGAASRATAADGFAIVGATVIDGTGAPALADAVIVVLKEETRAVGRRAEVALPKGIPYLDGRGLFVLPGRLRQPKVRDALRAKVRGGTAFERALAEILGGQPSVPADATIEPGHRADLAVLEKDPRASLDNLDSIKRAFVAGRETAP
jgi:hypothetical protein